MQSYRDKTEGGRDGENGSILVTVYRDGFLTPCVIITRFLNIRGLPSLPGLGNYRLVASLPPRSR